MSLKVVIGKPPNYDEIAHHFDLRGKDVVFTYGNTLYNPGGNKIEEHLMMHEEVHAEQQKVPHKWWKQYLKDSKFRLEQELEAYAVQYRYASEMIRDKNRLYNFLNRIASDLAGPIYGNVLTQGEAESKIKNATRAL